MTFCCYSRIQQSDTMGDASEKIEGYNTHLTTTRKTQGHHVGVTVDKIRHSFRRGRPAEFLEPRHDNAEAVGRFQGRGYCGSRVVWCCCGRGRGGRTGDHLAECAVDQGSSVLPNHLQHR